MLYLTRPLSEELGVETLWRGASWIETVVVVWMSDFVTGRAKNKT
ncbi:MAG: hypothetical protein WAN03_15655 [Candidatus Sulfotelmatobacter sp.]